MEYFLAPIGVLSEVERKAAKRLAQPPVWKEKKKKTMENTHVSPIKAINE